MQVTIDDGENIQIPEGADRILVRDKSNTHAAVADPTGRPYAVKRVDPSNPKVQQGLQQGSLQFVGTVD